MSILTLVTGPASEPVSTADLKTHLRIILSDEDDLLADYLLAAREFIEEDLNQSIVATTWDESFKCWPKLKLHLSRYPVTSITSVKYYDADNVEQTWDSANYTLIAPTKLQGYIYPATTAIEWPDLYDRPDAITVRYVAGWSSIPERAKHAIKLLAGHWYENREAVSPMSIKEIPIGLHHLLNQLRSVKYV